MSKESSPQLNLLPCGGYVSTAFVFASVGSQNAANSVYAAKSTIDGQNALLPNKANVVHTFKTDAERMQYLLGKMATVKGCSGISQ